LLLPFAMAQQGAFTMVTRRWSDRRRGAEGLIGRVRPEIADSYGKHMPKGEFALELLR
jgi:hypothetical protein